VEGIDEVIEIDVDSGVRDISMIIKNKGFDAAIALFPEYRLGKALKSAGIPLRAGIAYRWYSPLFNYRHREHRKHNIKHEVEYNLSLTYAVFRDAGSWEEYLQPDDIFPLNLRIPEGVKDTVERHLKSLDTGMKIVAIHPGGGGSAHRWPVERYCEVASYLAHSSDVQLIVTGNQGEADLCREVIDAGGQAVNMCGKLSLVELAEAFRHCDLLVTNSTGPLHLARAVGTNVLGLFPHDHAMSPVRWGPYGLPRNVLMPPHGQLMTELTPENVTLKIEILLNRSGDDE
jgi:ADP-heptose:LPS heptosyltransferase